MRWESGEATPVSTASEPGCPVPQLTQIFLHLSTPGLAPGRAGGKLSRGLGPAPPPFPLPPAEGYESPRSTRRYWDALGLALWTRPATDTRQKEGHMTPSDPGTLARGPQPAARLPKTNRRHSPAAAAQGKRHSDGVGDGSPIQHQLPGGERAQLPAHSDKVLDPGPAPPQP